MAKGIILAGGNGTRLRPITCAISKQLIPVYDKPMIYYPLCTLMTAGIRDILIITRPDESALFRRLLSDGSQWGISLRYISQPEPRGIAHAFLIGEEFIAGDHVTLILGDSIFYSTGLAEALRRAREFDSGAQVFLYRVHDPERYGVAEFNSEGTMIRILEKPPVSPSPYAVTGLYCYDAQVCAVARTLKPSPRGELEITDINNWYLAQGSLRAELLGQETIWMDMGTLDALMEASNFVAAVEHRQRQKIGSPEEAAFRHGFIDREQFLCLTKPLLQAEYGRYLRGIADIDSAKLK